MYIHIHMRYLCIYIYVLHNKYYIYYLFNIWLGSAFRNSAFHALAIMYT